MVIKIYTKTTLSIRSYIMIKYGVMGTLTDHMVAYELVVSDLYPKIV